MEKKLPGVYKNPIDHPIKNNKDVHYVGSEKVEPEKSLIREEKVKRELFGDDVNQKINQIFSSSNYVYKADVEITLSDRTVTKKIVGKNRNTLITIDNELIPIKDIVDIKLIH